jgi:hypothetical protein
MQDNSEESIRKWEEGSDQLIREREERDEKWEWEPKFEEIEGIKPEQEMSRPKAPHLCVPKDLLDQRDASHLVSR